MQENTNLSIFSEQKKADTCNRCLLGTHICTLVHVCTYLEWHNMHQPSKLCFLFDTKATNLPRKHDLFLIESLFCLEPTCWVSIFRAFSLLCWSSASCLDQGKSWSRALLNTLIAEIMAGQCKLICCFLIRNLIWILSWYSHDCKGCSATGRSSCCCHYSVLDCVEKATAAAAAASLCSWTPQLVEQALVRVLQFLFLLFLKNGCIIVIKLQVFMVFVQVQPI